jgi:selenocysteine lyase/cysteine desulfurase
MTSFDHRQTAGSLTPAELRADIPALQQSTCMNHGAHGPSPRYVVSASQEFLVFHEYDSPIPDDPYGAAFGEFDDVCKRVASFIGAEPDEIALTESTTAGINAVADGLGLHDGDVVVRTDLEHPTGTLPWQRPERDGVEVCVVPTGEGRLDRESFKTAVRGANLVCFSALTWTQGTKLPVAELVDIAHDAGAFALVDAVQVLGQLPMNVSAWGADAVAAAGHEWLLGLWGGGFLYVNGDVADSLHPRTVGYRSVETPTADPFEYAEGARRFEVGSTDPAPHVALREVIDTVEDVGVERIESRTHALASRFTSKVPSERPLSSETPESGLVTVDVGDPEKTLERLASKGMVVRSLPQPSAVRASIHAVNTESEIDRLAATLETSF